MNRPIFLLCVLASAASMPDRARADGNEILAKCQVAVRFANGEVTTLDANQSGDMGFCVGLVQGVTHMVAFLEDRVPGVACLPPNITNAQAARVLVRFLSEHPELLHEGETLLVMKALHEAFPCAANGR